MRISKKSNLPWAACFMSLVLSMHLQAQEGPSDNSLSGRDRVITPKAIDDSASSPLTEGVLEQLAAIYQEKQSWTAVQRKIDCGLLVACKLSLNQPVDARVVRSLSSHIQVDTQDMVEVKIRCSVSKALINLIEDLGGVVQQSYPEYSTILARIPIHKLALLAAEEAVRSIQRPDQGVAYQVHSSPGDMAHRAGLARDTFGVDGTGVTIAVLSTGVDSISEAQAMGVLPANIDILPGQEGSRSEGKAMLEIVHGLAPGADLMFGTAFGGQEQMATNILALGDAGADVIVDDFAYFAEPAFQDGPIAQAVRAVVENNGVTYFAAIGNKGNLNDSTAGVWEGDFDNSGTAFFIPPNSEGVLHDFLPNGGEDLANDVLVSSPFSTVLQWADPWGASANDFDVCTIDAAGVVRCSVNTQDGDDDPIEIIPPVNQGDEVMIVKLDKPADSIYLRLDTSGSGTFRGTGDAAQVLEHSTNGAITGHAGARDVIAVGAVNAAKADIDGAPGVFDAGDFLGDDDVESFSSDGPRRVFFDADGNPFTPGDFSSTGGLVRQKPDIAAADGVSTSTPGFETFFGTSAAAPHAAGIAALLREADPTLTPGQIKAALFSTALDIEADGFDENAGFGLVNALDALHGLPGGRGNGLINNALTPDRLATAFDPDDPRAPAGVFTINARFANSTPQHFADVFFEVTALSGGNVVLNSVGDRRVGSRISGPDTVAPDEAFNTVFEIGLQEASPFRFFVDAFGTADGAHPGDPIDLSPPAQEIPQALVLDSFDDPAGQLDPFAQGDGILGGERDFIPEVFGPGASDFHLTDGSLVAEVPGFGGFNLIYDGIDGSHNRTWRGLGGVDVTDAGEYDEFFMTINDAEGTWFLDAFFHDGPATFFGAGAEIPGGGAFPKDVIVPLASLSQTGNPKLDDIGLVGVFAQGSGGPGGSTTRIEIGEMGFRSSQALDPTIVVPITGDLDLEALDVLVPFGVDEQSVLSRITLAGQGSGTAKLGSFERTTDQLDADDPMQVDVLLDLVYDVTFFDIDPDHDYDSALSTRVSATGLSSTLSTSHIGIADFTKPNFGILLQIDDLDWHRDNSIQLPSGNTLFIPSSRLRTRFSDQTLIDPQFIFADGFESGDTSAWTSSPPYRVTTKGTLTIRETQVIAPE